MPSTGFLSKGCDMADDRKARKAEEEEPLMLPTKSMAEWQPDAGAVDRALGRRTRGERKIERLVDEALRYRLG
jgi:hypothetical protein